MRPASQVVKMNVAINRPMLRKSSPRCSKAFPVATRTIITMGDVNGMIEHQNTAGPSGLYTAVWAMKSPTIMGMVMGIMNCCVSVSASTAEPTAAKSEL